MNIFFIVLKLKSFELRVHKHLHSSIFTHAYLLLHFPSGLSLLTARPSRVTFAWSEKDSGKNFRCLSFLPFYSCHQAFTWEFLQERRQLEICLLQEQSSASIHWPHGGKKWPVAGSVTLSLLSMLTRNYKVRPHDHTVSELVRAWKRGQLGRSRSGGTHAMTGCVCHLLGFNPVIIIRTRYIACTRGRLCLLVMC